MRSMYSKREGIQLAYPYCSRRLARIYSPPYIVQPKLNGERCRILTDREGNPTLLSSEKNEITSVPHIADAIRKLKLPNFEGDGELYNHEMSLQRIRSIVSRKRSLHPLYEEVGFHMFDVVTPYEQARRLDIMYGTFRPLFAPPLFLVDSHLARTEEDIESILINYLEEDYEGIIVRDRRSHYVRKRSTLMMKWKPRKRDSYLIVGFSEEVSIDGEPKGRLGSLTCTTDGEEFNVGSGTLLTHANREELWEIRESLPGKYATIRYPELTDRGVPSHPVVVEISDFCDEGEDDA